MVQLSHTNRDVVKSEQYCSLSKKDYLVGFITESLVVYTDKLDWNIKVSREGNV